MFPKRLIKSILLTALIVLLLSLAIAPSYACEPTPLAFNHSLAELVDNAPIILVGTVTGGSTEQWGNRAVIVEAEIEVEQYLKGEGPSIVRITGYGAGPDCRSTVETGQRAVFFASGDPDGTLQAQYLGVYDATWEANEASISEITSITNHAVAPYPLPLTAQALRVLNKYSVQVFMGIFIIFCGLAVFFVSRLPRDKRKRIAKNS